MKKTPEYDSLIINVGVCVCLCFTRVLSPSHSVIHCRLSGSSWANLTKKKNSTLLAHEPYHLAPYIQETCQAIARMHQIDSANFAHTTHTHTRTHSLELLCLRSAISNRVKTGRDGKHKSVESSFFGFSSFPHRECLVHGAHVSCSQLSIQFGKECKQRSRLVCKRDSVNAGFVNRSRSRTYTQSHSQSQCIFGIFMFKRRATRHRRGADQTAAAACLTFTRCASKTNNDAHMYGVRTPTEHSIHIGRLVSLSLGSHFIGQLKFC